MSEQLVRELADHPLIQAAQHSFAANRDEIVELAIAIQQIPAPTGHERERGLWVRQAFDSAGLQQVQTDPIGNVYGLWPGAGRGPGVAVAAHLDTVFPMATNLAVHHDAAAGRIYGPGLGDNSMGVAGLIALARLVVRMKLVTAGPIWFVADVGEEGLGDLRGMRAATDRLGGQVGTMIALEGGGFGMICHQGIAVRRYEIVVTAPGGHSWSDFGAPSALHELMRLGAQLSELRTTERPRTTFNIGRAEGGTSINTIAERAAMQLDLRAESSLALAELVSQVDQMIAAARRRVPVGVTISINPIGDRPGGSIDRSHPLTRIATESLVAAGVPRETIEYRAGSTDANIPLSRGIPAVCIGLTDAENAHRTDEYIVPDRLPQGLTQVLLVLLAAAGGLV